MNPLRRLFPPSLRARPAPAVRPAGALEDETGLLLRALPGPESARVFVDDIEVVPERQDDGSAFVSLAPSERHRLDIRGVGAVQSAWVTVKEGPPRILSYALIPTTEVFGSSLRVTAPARVNFVNFPVGADVLVDGALPPRDAVEWTNLGRVRTFRVGEGRHRFEVRRGAATGLLFVGAVTVDVVAGEILDLAQTDFPELDAGVSTGTPTGTPEPSPSTPPAPGGPSKAPPRVDNLQPDTGVAFFPSQPPLASQPPQVTVAPGALEVSSGTPGASVSVDGVPVSGPPFRAMLAPGAHRIDVAARGYATRTLEVRAETGRTDRLRVDLTALDAAPREGAKPPASRRSRTVALVSLGLGLAAVAGVGLALAMTKPKPPPPAAPAARRPSERKAQGDGSGASS